MSFKSTYISILLTILAALSCHGQSWNEIKQSRQYLYGEGWGSSDAEADKNALADLISKISVQVQGSFTMTEDEMSHGNDVDGTTYARSKVQTYSQATLTNAEKMVLDYEPDAHVGRYILRSELSRIFESRKKRIHEMLQLAQEAEKQTKIDDALRYYYWSYALLKTLQRPDEATDAAGHVLSSWIPAQMDAIFSAIKVTPMSKTADNVMEVAVTYKGQPVASYDYTYFDGQNWSNIYSAKDGRGVIELNPGAVTDNLRVKSEYEYRSEAHIDNEIDAVLATVKGHAFRKSYLAVSGRTPSNSESRMALASIETKQSEPVVEPMTDDADYRKIIDKVLAAITTKNYASAEQYFTPQGATMFRSLISYGKARVRPDVLPKHQRRGVPQRQDVVHVQKQHPLVVCRGRSVHVQRKKAHRLHSFRTRQTGGERHIRQRQLGPRYAQGADELPRELQDCVCAETPGLPAERV